MKKRLGQWQWDVMPYPANRTAPPAGNVIYVLKDLAFTVKRRYTGVEVSKKVTFRIAPDDRADAWRLDYQDAGMYSALTNDHYKTPEEAAIALDKVLKSEDDSPWSKNGGEEPSLHEKVLRFASDLPKGSQERKALLLLLASEAPRPTVAKSASRDIADQIIPQVGILKLVDFMEDNKDDESAQMVLTIYRKIVSKLDLPEAETQALRRLQGCIKNVGSWDVSLQRNNIFKAADQIGIKLPHGFFA